VEEKESDGGEERDENEKKEEEEVKDVEKGEVGFQEQVIGSDGHGDFHVSRMQRLNPSNPLRLVINSATRVGTPSPPQPVRPARPARPSQPAHPAHPSQPAHPAHPAPVHRAQPRSTPTQTPTPQVSYHKFAQKYFESDAFSSFMYEICQRAPKRRTILF
jgi:hypothetical protein